jgi:manganese-dependent ADP-ribose/CDP-alcohol diphosphatase
VSLVCDLSGSNKREMSATKRRVRSISDLMNPMSKLFLRTCAITFALLTFIWPARSGEEAPAFSFGVISDIQYADQDTRGPRHYRESLQKLQECSAALNSRKLAFVIQLGDLVDGGVNNLDTILPVLNGIHAPKYNVLGNHDFCVDRAVLLKKLGMPGAYYQFSRPGWRFVVLDGMNISAAGSWPENLKKGREMLSELSHLHANNAQIWNGAVGGEQRRWLADVLSKADRHKENVIVFSHFPVLEASCRPNHLTWDHQKIVELLEKHPQVRGFFNGHDHNGGYGLQSGIHYVTFSAMVEHSVADTCNVVSVYRNRMAIRSAIKDSERILVFSKTTQ